MNKNNKAEPSEDGKILRPSILMWRSFKRDKAALLGSIMVVVLLFVAIFCPLIVPHDPLATAPAKMLSPAGTEGYLLGSDRFGRDQLSRLMYGTRTSMLISFGSVLIAVVSGLMIGLVSGYYGGKLDNIIMRCVDVVFALPVILHALVLIAIAGPSMANLLFTIGFIYSVRIVPTSLGHLWRYSTIKEIPGSKTLSTALAWGAVIALLPLLESTGLEWPAALLS